MSNKGYFMVRSMIVSDIGGTNGRFAVAEFPAQTKKGLAELKSIGIFPCKDYDSFNDLLADYLKSLSGDIPKTARFAIAGEITADYGNLWHFNWDINAREI